MRNPALVILMSPIVASCGIGSEGVPETDISGPEGPAGLYSGTTSNGRVATGLVLDDGSFYVLYAASQQPGLIAGAVQGTAAVANGTLSSTNAKDLNLEGNGVLSANVSLTFVPKKTLRGTITYPLSNQTITVTSTYDARYERRAVLSDLIGSFSGQAAAPSPRGLQEGAMLVVSATGVFSGTSSGGCAFTGNVVPRTNGNAFDAVITFGGVPCLLPAATLRGVAFFDDVTKRLYAIVMTQGRDTGFVFAGIKQ